MDQGSLNRHRAFAAKDQRTVPKQVNSAEAPALQLGWVGIVNRTDLNQPLVTTGTGYLPLPIGALPQQPERPKARTAEQITNNNFLIGHPA
jgi:hypothetical protein